MPEYTPSALAMLTEFFTSDDIEHTARRTGFVKRASKITGKIFLALVTFGVWSDAKTTLAQLAAKVTHVVDHLEVSPEAIHQRMNKRAVAFLQDMIRQAFTKMNQITLQNSSTDLLPINFPASYENGKLDNFLHRWMKNSEHNNFLLMMFPEKRYFS